MTRASAGVPRPTPKGGGTWDTPRVSRDDGGTVVGRTGLQALAALVLARDTSGTQVGQQVSHGGPNSKVVGTPLGTPSGAPPARRLVVVHFSLAEGSGHWHTAIGPSAEAIVADLRDRYGSRLIGTRPSAISGTART